MYILLVYTLYVYFIHMLCVKCSNILECVPCVLDSTLYHQLLANRCAITVTVNNRQ
jgi:hypothetical protein